jgi:hypothetical protein
MVVGWWIVCGIAGWVWRFPHFIIQHRIAFIFLIPFPIVDRRENGMLKRKWDWISRDYERK